MSEPKERILDIESLDGDGQGVARHEGKVFFVEGALPGERVRAQITVRRASFEMARTLEVLQPGQGRRAPPCPAFGLCGGCVTQHADQSTELAAKQRGLEDNLARIGKVQAETLLPMIYGAEWGYRSRARLSVRHVHKKGSVLVGFREKKSSYVVDMQACPNLPPATSALIPALRDLLGTLESKERMPQIEIAVGERATVLVVRHLTPVSEADGEKLRAFAEQHHVSLWLQSKGPLTAVPFHPPERPTLDYSLPEFDVRIAFEPTDFTQVNQGVNRVLVRRAMYLLDPQPGERIADLFCGLGNFSLPIARSGAHVLGLEGAEGLVRRARDNATANGLTQNTQFETANLFTPEAADLKRWGRFDKLLIDPPREGAIEVVKALGQTDLPQRIVYVSCDPATLARDAGMLVNVSGYRLRAAGVVNMFPHTAHVESIAWFERST